MALKITIKKIRKFIKEIVKLFRLNFMETDGQGTKQIPQDMPITASLSPHAIKLNIGGGKNHPKKEGWKIIDLREKSADYTLDITKQKLPFADNSVDVIFSSHTLEHIYPQFLPFVLGEFYRVLKPAHGLLRISVPDIRKAIKAYEQKDYTFFARSNISTFSQEVPLGGVLASWFYSSRVFNDPELKYGDGNVHCFDADYLIWWIRKTGFRRVWESSYRSSILEELRQEGFDFYENDSLFVEALK